MASATENRHQWAQCQALPSGGLGDLPPPWRPGASGLFHVWGPVCGHHPSVPFGTCLFGPWKLGHLRSWRSGLVKFPGGNTAFLCFLPPWTQYMLVLGHCLPKGSTLQNTCMSSRTDVFDLSSPSLSCCALSFLFLLFFTE